jgi:hypothetical protein
MRRALASPSGSFHRALLVLAFLCACASAPDPVPADPVPADPAPGGARPPPGPLPRSSIAAVLLHGGELGLDPAQIEALAERDAALAARLDRVRSELGAARAPGEGGGRAPGAGSERGARGGGRGGPGGPSGGNGGGMGPPGAGPPAQGGGGPPDRDGARAALAARADDEDTRAWLGAEALLRPEQREAARTIASEYRAARYDLLHGKRPAPR